MLLSFLNCSDQIIHDAQVEIVATDRKYRRSWRAPEGTVTHIENGNIERTSAQIVDSDHFIFLLSSPYASEEAVGSLMIRSTSSPAILPASLVALRCASLKYAVDRDYRLRDRFAEICSASRLIFARIIAETSGGE